MSAIDHLNEQQKLAASATDGVIRVVAGPGTGKTATKTARIAHMVNSGIEAESIVALTFTNKAADEMRERIVNQTGKAGYYVFAGTYHKFFIQKILSPNKHHAYFQKLGYKDGFFILDTADADRLMQQTLKNLSPGASLVKDVFDFNKKNIFSWMGDYRAYGLMPHEVLKKLGSDQDLIDAYHLFDTEIRRMGEQGYSAEEAERDIQMMVKDNPQLLDVFKAKVIWKEYQAQCVKMEGVDFDDVLVHAYRLLQLDPGLAQRLSNQFKYFSLDEYQDTNHVQHRVIHSIATAGNSKPNIFVVGDPRQSIYGFRHADVRLMSEMHNTYPDLQDIALTTNYRSSTDLLTLTNALAIEMQGQITDGQLTPPQPKPGAKPTIAYFSKDDDEAVWIADQIQTQIANGEDVSDTAILYRSRALRGRIEDELLSRDMSYEIIGDVSFWERREVRDTMSLIRLVVRENDDLALNRLLDNSVLPLTALTARKKSEREGIRPMVQLESIAYPKSGRPTLKSKQAEPFIRRYQAIKTALPLTDVNRQTADQINQALLKPLLDKGYDYHQLTSGKSAALLSKMHAEYKRSQTSGLINIIEGLYEDFVWPKQQDVDLKSLEKKDASPEEIAERLASRRASVKQVLKIFYDQIIERSATLQDALDELTLRAESEPERQQSTVKLMTNHASKGLEFKKVYAVGAEAQSYWREDDLSSDVYDEEGRNFYVAITRAENDLVITSSCERFINGETKLFTPLPFLTPIEQHAQVIDNRDDYQKQTSNGDDATNYFLKQTETFNSLASDLSL